MFTILLTISALLGPAQPVAQAEPFDGPKREYYIILDPKERTMLSTRITSPVEKINKRMGDAFERGDLLLELDNEIYQAEYLKTKALLEKAQTDVDAKRSLYQDNAASLFELKEAEAELAVAKADVVTARETYDETTLRAPYRGKVVSVFIEEHELPQAGTELLEILRDDILVAKFLVSSDETLVLGMPVYFTLNETGETIEATITRISPEIDPSSGTIKVEAEIDNMARKFLPGMSGTASFYTSKQGDNGRREEKER